MREMSTFMQPGAPAEAGAARGIVMSAMADPTVGLCPAAGHRRPGAPVVERNLGPAEGSDGMPMM
jgi:hypothetical protein